MGTLSRFQTAIDKQKLKEENEKMKKQIKKLEKKIKNLEENVEKQKSATYKVVMQLLNNQPKSRRSFPRKRV